MSTTMITTSFTPYHHHPNHCIFSPTIHAFRRTDFTNFTKKVKSGEAIRDAWRNTSIGFEQILFDAKKTAERIDRQYSVSRRVSEVAKSAAAKAKEIDRELEIGKRAREFSNEFKRDLPRYRKELIGFLDAPLGKSVTTIFFLWFVLSGWMFRFVAFGAFVLPFAAPLLIGTVANNFMIEGECPACKKRFMGYKNQIVRCTSCSNVVWEPKSNFSQGDQGRPQSSTSRSDIIDVEFEEK